MSFTSIALFGDSLSDTGLRATLIEEATGQFLPPFPYIDGKFSNGDLHIEYLAEELGVDVDNFALASARAVGSRPLSEILIDNGLTPTPETDAFDINLQAQIDRFLDGASGDLSNTAAALMIGANDLGNFEPSSNPVIALLQIRQLVNSLGDAVIDGAKDLAEAGVGTIIYYTLPNASFFPAILDVDPALQGIADGIVADVNGDILAALQEDPAFDGVTVEIIDFNRLALEVTLDPETFGFIADPYTVAVTADPNDPLVPVLDLQGFEADQLIFWDPIHPTTAFHGILGLFTEASLEKEERFLGNDDDVVKFGAADDFVLAGGGDDTINAGNGDDIVFGSRGSDSLKGAGADDILSGGSGRDIVVGNNGSDILAGGKGADELRGGRSDDFLVGGLGNDIVKGGAGDDIMVFVDPTLIGGDGSSDTYRGGDGTDTLYVVMDAEHFEAVSGADDLIAALEAEVGLDVRGVEDIVILSSRDALHEELADTRWEDADTWGFV